jgi:tRNA dimethylallyltransferase
MTSIDSISHEAPVLIAGPTASGKSALAMEIAARDGRLVVNADALQVYANWRILTARPGGPELFIPLHILTAAN